MIHNFSPGPCILPKEVFKEASESVLNFNNSGLSILEISHRSKDFIAIMEEAKLLVKELLNVPEGYSVLFLQGGASLGFYISTLNFLKQGGKAGFLDTGEWSSKAIKEAKKVGDISVIASSQDKGYKYVPKEYKIPENLDFYHYTSNNTIYGTKVNTPDTNVPVICDMSSDIFSKPIDVSKYAMIYAGAQKNMGPAGSTLYIVKEELLNKTGRDIPSYLDLSVHIEKDSMFNTPPVFSVYVSMLTLRWLKKLGGVSEMEAINRHKANILYNVLDTSPLFRTRIEDKQDRSLMNVTFTLNNSNHEKLFNTLWSEANISGLKGHRKTGGYRASLYNALPITSVEHLVNTIKSFTP